MAVGRRVRDVDAGRSRDVDADVRPAAPLAPDWCERPGRRVRVLPALRHAALPFPDANEAVANVKPGTLDDTSWLRPIAHLWVRSARPAVEIPPGVLVYDDQPDDFTPLYDAWRALGLFA